MRILPSVLLIVCVQTSIMAQSNANNNSLNTINRLLTENSLYKANMTAQDYNAAGMFFYNRRSWTEAELMFSMAVKTDKNHVLACYNLTCVWSIQLNQFNNDRQKYNEVLEEDIGTPVVFGYLSRAITLDPARGIRARQDADFDNLRKYDPILFDTVTLPEDQREIYRYDVTYVDFVVFEGNINCIFAEIGYENNRDRRLWIDGRDAKLRDKNLYYRENEWDWSGNKEMFGKRFIIEYIYEPRGSEFVGGNGLFKQIKVVSIKEKT